MECVVCASEIPVTSKVCPYCGHVVKPTEMFPNSSGLPLYIESEKSCKYCGSPIDPDTGICTHCNRSYKKINKSFITIFILSILLVISIIIAAVLFNSYHEANENYMRYYNQYTDYAESAMRLRFFDENVVFIEDVNSDNVYHVYQCDSFRMYDWMGGRAVAESDGYKPCPQCHKE